MKYINLETFLETGFLQLLSKSISKHTQYILCKRVKLEE